MTALQNAPLKRHDGEWRGLDQPDILAARLELLRSPKMTALNEYVARLRQRFGEIPNFDPLDGGSNAKLLLLLETPGPSTASVRFVSRDNPTGTARNIRALFSGSGIARTDSAIWNTVPWVVHERENRRSAPSRSDVMQARSLLPELLPLFPHLRAVILAGRTARGTEINCRQLRIFRMAHPSPTHVNTSVGIFAEMMRTFQLAETEVYAGER